MVPIVIPIVPAPQEDEIQNYPYGVERVRCASIAADLTQRGIVWLKIKVTLVKDAVADSVAR